MEAAEANRRLEEERRKVLEEAAKLAQAERIQRYRLAIAEDYLVLRCPRCQAAFYEYNGCDALTCGHCAAGFCAFCLTGKREQATVWLGCIKK